MGDQVLYGAITDPCNVQTRSGGVSRQDNRLSLTWRRITASEGVRHILICAVFISIRTRQPAADPNCSQSNSLLSSLNLELGVKREVRVGCSEKEVRDS